MLWRSGALGVHNEVVLTGGAPPEGRRPGGLPPQLMRYAEEWYEVEAPKGKKRGWILS